VRHHEQRGHCLSVSVVVPSREGGPLAAETVARALADPATREVVVILDHADTPGADLAELAAEDARVRVVDGGGRGPASARALGARIATGDVVLFLDDDVVPTPLLATGHAAAHEQHPHAVVVGSMPVAPAALRREATARVYAKDYERVVARYTDPAAVLLDLWGGNVSIRRDDCLAVGMTAGVFVRALHEDRDLGLRCRAAGMTGVFDARLRAEHRYTRSVRRFLHVAHEQVAVTRALHSLHEDVLGPWDAGAYVRGLPRLVTRAVGAVTTRPSTARAAVELLVASGLLARALGARRVEDTTVWLARTIVQHGEARRAAVDLPASTPLVASAGDESSDAGDHHHEPEQDVDERAGDGRLREVSRLPA
jgi:GT2 family glycosyltransferase